MTNATQTAMENDGGPENLNARRRIHLREISGEDDSPLDSVGQDLRNARLRRGDEIAQVSRALKIRKDHLEALEEDRPEDLPGRTYALGFVRSYAQYLGLDAGELATRYKHDISGRAEEAAEPVAPIHQDERRLPQGWLIIAVLLVGVLGYGVWHLLSGREDAGQAVPPAPSLSPPKPATPKPIVVPMQQQGAAPSSSEQADAAAPDEAMPAPAAGPQTPATRIENPVSAQPVADTGADDSASGPAVPSSGRVFGEQNSNPRVVLRARGSTRVTVHGPDGMLYINRDLAPGDVYRVPNLTGLTLAVADAGAIEVDLDGQALGRVGQSHQVLGKVSLEPQSLMDRFNR
ncbi:MAG: helix-turn-helix domain-containing protein [Alphaproteobacteria bacterium]|nr:helix-turn-helix domain-containing protein [Alphaproteobacteria bacterium]